METIGRYQLQEKIGQGGMGTVFRAYDPNLGRDVALKLLPPELRQNESFLLRFKREARVVARLEHPSIVPIYDVGDQDGQPYLVMRLLTGGTLRGRLDQRDIGQDEFLAAMMRIAEALDLAHQRGIIHRDIKPTNIMFDDEARPFLSDFGVAKDTGADVTLTGQAMVGTPVYMSPEQFTAGTIDGRSDQYSLAVVIFEALTGQPPFSGNTMQIMYQHVNEPPPDLTQLNHNLPPALTVVMNRALAKERLARFPTVKAFVQAVRSSLSATNTVLMEQAYEPTMLAETPAEFGLATPMPQTPRPSTPPYSAPSQTSQPHPPTPALAQSKAQTGGSRKWVGLGLLLLLLLLVGGGVWFFFLGGNALLLGGTTPTAVPSTDTSTTTGDEPTTPETFTVLVSGGVDDGFWQVEDDLSRLPSDGRLRIPLGTPHEIQSTREPLTIVLPDGSYLVLDRNTAVQIVALAGANDAKNTVIELSDGELLLVPNDPDAPIIIQTPSTAQASTADGVMGVTFNDNSNRFELDCFSTACELISPTAASQNLSNGQASMINSNGEISALPGARFDRFAESAAVLPTPTSSPTSSPTDTPTVATSETPRPTSTNTPEPTEIAAVDDDDEDEDEDEDEEGGTPPPTVTRTDASATATPRSSQNSGGAAGSGAGLPQGFELFGTWVIGDEPNGSFTQSSTQVHSGSFAGKLDYDFATEDNDYVVFLQFNDIDGQPNALQMWVHGDGAGHYLNLWIQDREGQTWQVPMGRVTHNGWKLMTGYIDPEQEWPWTHISGPRNDTVDYPIQLRGVVLDDINNAFTGAGTLYLDDLAATTLADGPSTGSGSSSSSGSSGSSSSPTATAVPVEVGDLGRIIYTSGNTLLTTDPSWSSAKELGTLASDSCGSPATTVAGQSYRVYYSPKCGISEGTTVCSSPNGAYEAIFNGSFNDGFTISVRPAGADGAGTFIYGGKDFDLQEGIRWSPASDRFLFMLDDTLQAGFPGGGYNTLLSPVYNPTFSTDGSFILYRKPVGPGVNDVFVANADGSNAQNVTNNTAVDKRCAGWLLP